MRSAIEDLRDDLEAKVTEPREERKEAVRGTVGVPSLGFPSLAGCPFGFAVKVLGQRISEWEDVERAILECLEDRDREGDNERRHKRTRSS